VLASATLPTHPGSAQPAQAWSTSRILDVSTPYINHEILSVNRLCSNAQPVEIEHDQAQTSQQTSPGSEGSHMAIPTVAAT
jgi:hypothetical protein